MAHFARLNSDDIVTLVIVINNEVITDENGVEQEALGIAFCKSLFEEETNWVQTSYNSNFRGAYAGVGVKYDRAQDKFIIPTVATEPE